MNTCWKSRIGWVFVASYFILASYLFQQALTCEGWVCDLVALPAAFPLGFPIAWLFDGIDYLFVLPDLTGGLLRKGYFILPTVLANSIFYFWVGWQLEKLVRRLIPGSQLRH